MPPVPQPMAQRNQTAGRRRRGNRTRRNRESGLNRFLSGTDLLAVVQLKTGDSAGQGYANLSLNPRTWEQTRVSQESKLWSRWRPVSLQIEVSTAASPLVGGAYALAWFADPKERLARKGLQNLRKALSLPTSLTRGVWQSGRLKLPIDPSQKWLFLEGTEEEDCEYGRLVLLNASPLTKGESAASLLVKCHWTYEFSGPDLEVDSADSGTYVRASAPNYFTTSVSDFDSTKLVFKWHEGGEAVGFPGATGSYYKLEAAASCPYIESNGAVATTEWAVRLLNYTNGEGDPVLAPVSSEDNAKAYAKAGDKKYLLTYKAAGPWISPPNPIWELKSGTTVQVFTSALRKKQENPYSPPTGGDTPLSQSFERLELLSS